MRSRFISIVAVCLILGCTSEPDIKYDKVLTLNLREVATDAPEYVESISYLPLETGDTCFFRNADKILFENGLIYIADYRSGQVLVYETDGSMHSVLDRKGRGPGEYLDMMSFTVDSDYIYVLDNFNRKIFRYGSMDCRFDSAADLDFVAWDMEAIGDGNFIFAFSPLGGGRLTSPQAPYRILITDSDFRVKETLLDYGDNEYDIIGQRRYFSVEEDKLIYSSIYFDGYIVFDRSDYNNRQVVGIEFDNPIPASARKDLSVLDKDYNYQTMTPIACGDYIMLEVAEGDNIGNYIYNCDTEKFSRNPDMLCRNCIYYPIANYKGCYVGVIESKTVYDEFIAAGFDKGDSCVEKSLGEGNPVLLFYKMK